MIGKNRFVILDDFGDDRFGAAESSSLPNLQAVEDSASDEQQQEDNLNLHSDKD
jgi:hypothetical protein